MKKYKLVRSIIIPTTAFIAVAPLASLNKSTSLKSIKKSTENSTGIFNLKDGVLYGFKEGITQQDLLDNMKDNTLVLPECNEIANGAFRDTILNDAPFGTTIEIPASTTSIGDFAFYGNTATSVTWSGTPTCTTIGKSAFGRCKNITSFTLPSTITTIKADAFMGCSTLATINCTALSSCPSLGNKSVFRGTKSSGSLTLTDSNAESIWMNFVDSGLNSSWTQKNSSGGTISKPKTIPTDYLTYSSVTDNEGNATLSITGVNTAICDITKFNKLSIPATINNVKVTQISASAFASKTSLTSVDLSAATNLTTINDKAFMGSTNITSVTLSTSITKIGQYAFAVSTAQDPSSAPALTTVTVPSGSNLTTVDMYAFNWCKNLKTFAFENTKITTLNDRSFRKTGLTKVTFPSTFVQTGYAAIFPACVSLTEIDLSACTNLTTLYGNFANACTALTTVKLPANISSIVYNAFSNDTALTSVSFANTSNGFTVATEKKATIDSAYMPISPYLNAEYLKNSYQFDINPITFTYSYLNVDNTYKSTFTIPYASTSSSITWTSSNENVATVSNGIITVPAGASGSTTITAKISSTVSSTCTINAITTASGVEFSAIDDTTAMVQRSADSYPTVSELTIPAVWNSRFVTTIPKFTTAEPKTYGFAYGTRNYSTSTTYNFPGTLTSIETNAFQKNRSGTTYNFQEPCNVNISGSNIWYDAAITSLTFPKGMTSINGYKLFHKNDDKTVPISYVKIPNTVGYLTGNWFTDDTTWGSGSLVLDLTEFNYVPTLKNLFGSSSVTGVSMTVKVKSSMLSAFQAATNWNDSRLTYVTVS